MVFFLFSSLVSISTDPSRCFLRMDSGRPGTELERARDALLAIYTSESAGKKVGAELGNRKERNTKSLRESASRAA